MQWESPWGPGRPGWHIECSAMATALLGPELDIHCGGVDNIFPHHEAEIAQSECCTGKKFVRYWLHCAHLMVEGQKMSKSLGNFYTLRDLLAKGWTGREVRYALLTVNYRLPLNFTFAGLEGARAALAAHRRVGGAPRANTRPAHAPEPTPLLAARGAFLRCARRRPEHLRRDWATSSTWSAKAIAPLDDRHADPRRRPRSLLADWQRINQRARAWSAMPLAIPAEVLALRRGAAAGARGKELGGERSAARRDRRARLDGERHQGRSETHARVERASRVRHSVERIRRCHQPIRRYKAASRMKPEFTPFHPELFVDLNHTEHRMLFENAANVWDALKQITSYLQFRLKPAIHGRLVGKPFISGAVFVGKGTVIEQGAMIKGPAWIGEDCEIRNGCYIRENVIVGSRLRARKLVRVQELDHLRRSADPAFQLRRRLDPRLPRASRRRRDPFQREARPRRDHDPDAGRRIVPTGLRKFGAIIGDRAEIGCNSVINPGSLIGRNTILYPGTIWRGIAPADSIVKTAQTQTVLARRE